MIMTPTGERPTGPFFFWCTVMTVGILFLVFGTGNNNYYMVIAGIFLSLPGAVFTAGTFWICVAGKKSYGNNVDDLV